MTGALLTAAVPTAIVFVLMLAELRLSRANERALRAQGAIEPADDVYAAMAWAYPIGFLAMGIEGGMRGRPPGVVTAIGVLVFASAKALKYWAMASLGPRWSFRVLVTPGVPLVTRGPYKHLRHPNYVGVMGELAGMALLVGAPVIGVTALACFATLIHRRIRTEDRALGRQSFTRP